MKKDAISTQNAPAAIGPYSQAVRAGDFLFISGQIAIDPPTGNITGTTSAEQAVQVLRNIESILRAAGLSMDNVVKTSVFVRNLADFQEINKRYAEFFKPPFPARATVEVARLPKDVLVEIDAIAHY